MSWAGAGIVVRGEDVTVTRGVLVFTTTVVTTVIIVVEVVVWMLVMMGVLAGYLIDLGGPELSEKASQVARLYIDICILSVESLDTKVPRR